MNWRLKDVISGDTMFNSRKFDKSKDVVSIPRRSLLFPLTLKDDTPLGFGAYAQKRHFPKFRLRLNLNRLSLCDLIDLTFETFDFGYLSS
jgi:hypothetical protein